MVDRINRVRRKNNVRDLAPELVRIDLLKPLGRITRRHSPEQIQHLAELIDRYGVVLPILADQQDGVVDGWAVVLAAKRAGHTQIPVVRNRDLSDAELRALKGAPRVAKI